MKDVKEFTIDRARWLCAPTQGYEDSELYRESDRKMCCLGFYARALGARVKDIKHKDCPSNAKSVHWTDWVLENGLNSLSTKDMIEENDFEVSNKMRERKIRGLFAKHGVKVKFTGKYPKKK